MSNERIQSSRCVHTIRMKKRHNYKDTIKEAAGINDDNDDIRRKRKTELFDYEVLAVDCAMGAIGHNQTLANLLQLELAQELMCKLDPETFEQATDRNKQDNRTD